VRVRLTDIRDHSVRELDLPPESREMPGWQNGVFGWSIGMKGSGAPIELDESLHECTIGVFMGRFQVLLWGTAHNLPEVWMLPQGRSIGSLVPFQPERWFVIEREELRRVAMGGDVHLRFDQSPIRLGNYIFESLKPMDSAQECCSFCEEPVRAYFRVGSQQACLACTEEFKRNMRANQSRYYRRAVIAGIFAAMAGGVIHSVLIAFTGLAVGAVLIGALVGVSIRRASRETATTRHRVMAIALTSVAGSLPLWGIADGSTRMTGAIYLAIGILVAWIIAHRNVPTEIHGPFQSKNPGPAPAKGAAKSG
jgi:hypothetical protein